MSVSVEINPQRLQRRLEELQQFGAQPGGGVTRYALSPEEQAATETVARWMAEAGLRVRRDPAGNLFGRLPGRRSGPAVLTGSHLDSVPNGGHYDGPVGVLGALEAVQAIREAGLTLELPLEVVSFIGEEGSRFPYGLLGSSFVAGTFPPDELPEPRDREGTSLAAALRAYGGDPEHLAAARAEPGAYAAYVEMHVEQSGVLEAQGLPVGIVQGIAGMKQVHAVIRGRAEHAGACPMELRRDPLPAAAEVALAAERVARESHPATRATVGFIQAHPGAANVIPAAVEMSFDVRDLEAGRRDACVDRIREHFNEVCRRRGLRGEWTVQHASPPVQCDAGIRAAMAAAARDVGLSPFELPSGAVHDAANMAQICPVGMVFVRSRDGLSHCPEEYSSPEDIAAGTRLLAATL